MKKMLVSVILCGVLGNPINLLQDLTIQAMKGVDFVGNTFNLSVIEEIDYLNEIWYSLEDMK